MKEESHVPTMIDATLDRASGVFDAQSEGASVNVSVNGGEETESVLRASCGFLLIRRRG